MRIYDQVETCQDANRYWKSWDEISDQDEKEDLNICSGAIEDLKYDKLHFKIWRVGKSNYWHQKLCKIA